MPPNDGAAGGVGIRPCRGERGASDGPERAEARQREEAAAEDAHDQPAAVRWRWSRSGPSSMMTKRKRTTIAPA